MAQDSKKQDSKKPSLPLHFLWSSDSPWRRSDGNAPPPSPESPDRAGGARPARKSSPAAPPDSSHARKGHSPLPARPGLLRRRASAEAEARPPVPAVSLAPASASAISLAPASAASLTPSPAVSRAPSPARRELSQSRGRDPTPSPARGRTPRPGAAAGEPPGADPYAPDATPYVPGGWLLRTTVLPPQANNRRDADGNTSLMRAARDADFVGLVDLLSIPGTDVTARNAAGQGAYDLLRRAVSDRTCPEFTVVSQALFLRTMLDLLIREEHYAAIARGHTPTSPRGLAKKVVARLSATYASQSADRALPFAALPSLDFVEAAILAIQ